MRIAVLTSSRADYGIYLPLLKQLESDQRFDLNLIVFGTHLSHFHGFTYSNIEKDGFKILGKLETIVLGDSEESVSSSMGLTLTKFSSFWSAHKEKIDLVFALGDRFEMFAAVAASVPFNIPIAHLHGGETTLGAIDNRFRHAITQMSNFHFTSTQLYAERVKAMVENGNNYIYNVGALSLDNLNDLELLDINAFKEQFNINLSNPTILSTFHPETVNLTSNKKNAETLSRVFKTVSNDFQVVITMPNVDPSGMVIRSAFSEVAKANSRIILIESFGKLGYFSCMKHCAFVLGNTSSGIIEAASFGKYFINTGDRQKGRAQSDNTINVAVEENTILRAINSLGKAPLYDGKNIYYPTSKSTVSSILNALSEIKLNGH